MIQVVKYRGEYHDIWNAFCRQAKNPIFMFQREYMEYHRDRFQDASLLFYKDERLVALLPMNQADESLLSHGGLTFGGFVTDNNMKQSLMNECVQALLDYMRDEGIDYLVYKAIPHMYHVEPAEEDLYSIFLYGGTLEKIEASTVIDLRSPLKMPKGRKAQISRAKREGVEVRELCEPEQYEAFIELENSVLESRHNTKAVHTGKELSMLHERFPENIHLIAAILHGEMIAGTVVFEYEQLVHTQYMAADDRAREIGGLDLVIKSVIDYYSESKNYLDFGKSTENDGKVLNEGLISQKEGFGGRTNIYSTYRLKSR